ncbi:TonB-dependent receptor plug domain-containing protein [Flavobacteriaceae bacterium LMO-SS05]
MNKKMMAFGILCSISSLGFAQQQNDSTQVQQLDEVVVTDSRFNLKREHSGKVITKITQNELQHLQGKSISQIINATAGIEINGTKGNSGQNLAYYIRGGRNRQVLVLIDGIAISDPSQIANDYDLKLLNADQIESIEILKGASSTLYGSGAATAVINVKLKEASKDKISANFRSALGTNQSQQDNQYRIEDFKNSVSFNGTLEQFNYLVSFGNQYSDGLSAVSNGSEPDAFNAINGQLKLGFKASDVFKISLYGSFDKFKTDFDDAFNRIDTDDVSKTNQYRLGVSPEFKYTNGSLTLNAAYNNIGRKIKSSYPATFNAESYVADVFNKYNFNQKFYTVLGTNIQRNSMESFTIPFGATNLEQSIDPKHANFTIIDPYANMVYVSDFGLNINAGVRLNHHSEYGNHVVYSINPSFRKEADFGYIKGLVSYSTAYITPSLYQLFEPTYGNPDLKPEENRTIEVGAEVNVKDKATFSLVYFNRKEQNFIDFLDLGSFVFQYKNVETDFTASGVELTTSYKFSDQVSLNANATYTKVEESLNLRIPKFKVNTHLDYHITEDLFLSLIYQFNDDRKDVVFNNSTFMNDEVILKNYSLFDAYLSHSILKNKMTVFANVTNILNEDYQELFGYSTKGRNITIGFNLKL